METGGKRIQGPTSVVLLLQGASESPGSYCKSTDTGPSREGSDSAGRGWAQESTFLTSSRVLVWERHLESHCSLEGLDAGGLGGGKRSCRSETKGMGSREYWENS